MKEGEAEMRRRERGREGQRERERRRSHPRFTPQVAAMARWPVWGQAEARS